MNFSSIFVRPEVENLSRVIIQAFKSGFDQWFLKKSTFKLEKSLLGQVQSGRSYEKVDGQNFKRVICESVRSYISKVRCF